jgi:hypothetical protein
MRIGQAKRLKDLEKENSRIKRLVADISLYSATLKESAQGYYRYSPDKGCSSSEFCSPSIDWLTSPEDLQAYVNLTVYLVLNPQLTAKAKANSQFRV